MSASESDKARSPWRGTLECAVPCKNIPHLSETSKLSFPRVAGRLRKGVILNERHFKAEANPKGTKGWTCMMTALPWQPDKSFPVRVTLRNESGTWGETNGLLGDYFFLTCTMSNLIPSHRYMTCFPVWISFLILMKTEAL